MILTCEDVPAAIGSLAAAFATTPQAIAEIVTAFDQAALRQSDDPAAALPKYVAERAGREAAELQMIRYFHGTRARVADSFCRDGLLCLRARLDRIWNELTEIGNGLLAAQEFAQLRAQIDAGGGGDGGWQYRTKAADSRHHGPYGEYVRDYYFRANELGSHDYLRTPEIVEDIALAAKALYEVDLLAAYSAATRPCIVTFDMPVRDRRDALRAVDAACWYVWSASRGEVTRDACGGFDGHGVSVPADAVRAVTFVDD